MSKRTVPHKHDGLGVFADDNAHVKVVRSLHAKGYTVDAIARATGLALAEVKRIVGDA